MSTTLDNYLRGKNQRYRLVLSSKIVDQRTCQSDWMKGPTDYTQKWQSQVQSKDTNEQIILQPDWKKSTTDHN